MVYTGEVNVKRIREKYLEAILRQYIAYFDTVGGGVRSRLAFRQTPVSPSLPTISSTLNPPSQVPYSKACPKRLLLLLALFPLPLPALHSPMLVAGDSHIASQLQAVSRTSSCQKSHSTVSCLFLPSPLTHPSHRLSLKHIADGGTLAEEVISSVRTVHAFNTQKNLYDIHIRGAHVFNAKSTMCSGTCMGPMFFIVYSAYALGMVPYG